MRRTARVTDALRGHKKAVAYAGTAAALLSAGVGAGAGVANAATAGPGVKAPAVADAALHSATARLAVQDAVTFAVKDAALAAGAHKGLAASPARSHGARTARHASAKAAGKGQSWNQVVKTVAKASPGLPKAADQLQPVAPAGPQAWMPVSGTQLANATTIVKQAYAKKMGIRSAVIAVATAMQESTLNNINYGTSDSVGLFQQRPSCGWGTVQQIMNPAYAADAFLRALQQHQAGDPAWATQPLWANAQAVQGSAFPLAYAKWETQAAHLVRQITAQVR